MADRYAGERCNPLLAICSALALKFYGSKLEMAGESKVYSYPVISGKPTKDGKFVYTKKTQKASFGSPISEGTYWINPDEL